MSALPFLPLQIFILMPLGAGSRHSGRGVAEWYMYSSKDNVTDTYLVFPEHPLGVNASHRPESFGDTPGYFFYYPTPQRKTLGNIIAVEGVIDTGE